MLRRLCQRGIGACQDRMNQISLSSSSSRRNGDEKFREGLSDNAENNRCITSLFPCVSFMQILLASSSIDCVGRVKDCLQFMINFIVEFLTGVAYVIPINISNVHSVSAFSQC